MNRRGFIKLIAVVSAAPATMVIDKKYYQGHMQDLLPFAKGIEITEMGVTVFTSASGETYSYLHEAMECHFRNEARV